MFFGVQSDLGVNTYIALNYHPANEEDLFEALDYIDKNNKNGKYEYLFLGLDPMLMHVNAKNLAGEITKHGFNKYAIFLPAFPMKYWTSMDVNLREETMQAYIDFVKEFDGVSNVTVYFSEMNRGLYIIPELFERDISAYGLCIRESGSLYHVQRGLYRGSKQYRRRDEQTEERSGRLYRC